MNNNNPLDPKEKQKHSVLVQSMMNTNRNAVNWWTWQTTIKVFLLLGVCVQFLLAMVLGDYLDSTGEFNQGTIALIVLICVFGVMAEILYYFFVTDEMKRLRRNE